MNPFRPGPLAILAGSFLFNLGQGALRPSLPLYLQRVFAANYRMVTLIPVVFGAGKWAATLPTGFLLDRLGRRRLMTAGLVIIAGGDIAAAMTRVYGLFLAIRALAGAGWAMFATVATTTMVDHPGRHRRGRAISLLLMSETLGLLLGSSAGGWLFRGAGMTGPFLFEAACLLIAAVALVSSEIPSPEHPPAATRDTPGRPRLQTVLRAPDVLLMGLITATLTAVQTGLLVFLYRSISPSAGAWVPKRSGI